MIDYIREVRSKGLLFIKDSTAIKTAIPSLLFTDINFYKVMWRYHIDTNYLKPVKDVDYRKLESEFFSMLFAETDGVLTRNAIEKWFAKLDKPINQLIKNSGQPYGYITYQNGKYQLENPQ